MGVQPSLSESHERTRGSRVTTAGQRWCIRSPSSLHRSPWRCLLSAVAARPGLVSLGDAVHQPGRSRLPPEFTSVAWSCCRLAAARQEPHIPAAWGPCPASGTSEEVGREVWSLEEASVRVWHFLPVPRLTKEDARPQERVGTQDGPKFKWKNRG